jgi:hypothetical protein
MRGVNDAFRQGGNNKYATAIVDFAQVIVGDTPQLASSSSFRISNETNPNFPHHT